MTMKAKVLALKKRVDKLRGQPSASIKTPPTTGSLAEENACEYLQRQGLSLVQRNFSCKFGEIDLVMRDKLVLVFVEVRFRKNSHYGSPLESVTLSKQEKIRITAQHYLQQHRIAQSQAIRFDVVGIMPGDIAWIQGAF